MVQPDARKTLAVLRKEWAGCTDCELGQRRVAVSGRFVFGEGKLRGLMVIGDGPSQEDEADGRPFNPNTAYEDKTAPGRLLRDLFSHWKFTDYYMTNTVACRSCAPMLDAVTGQPIINRQGVRYRDEGPLPVHMDACRARLMEEIYLVDPVVILSLGGRATEALTQRPTTLTKSRGVEQHIEVPGAGFKASLTEKKGVWLRRGSGGQMVAPVVQRAVSYLMVPTFDPAFVWRKISDRSKDGPFQLFAKDVLKTIRIYERYMLEVHGVVSKFNHTEDEDKDLEEMQNMRVDYEEDYDE